MRSMFGTNYYKVFTKMFSMSQAGLYKMYERVSQGVQLWMRLLQLGVSLMSGENNRPDRTCEKPYYIKRTT